MIQMACSWGLMVPCMPFTRYDQVPAAVCLGNTTSFAVLWLP